MIAQALSTRLLIAITIGDEQTHLRNRNCCPYRSRTVRHRGDRTTVGTKHVGGGVSERRPEVLVIASDVRSDDGDKRIRQPESVLRCRCC